MTDEKNNIDTHMKNIKFHRHCNGLPTATPNKLLI